MSALLGVLNINVAMFINSNEIVLSRALTNIILFNYGLEKAYFDNGYIIEFLYDYGYWDTLIPNDKVTIEDDSGSYWGIELTNIKAN